MSIIEIRSAVGEPSDICPTIYLDMAGIMDGKGRCEHVQEIYSLIATGDWARRVAIDASKAAIGAG